MSLSDPKDAAQAKIALQCLKEKALHYLSFRPRTEGEMTRYLDTKLAQCGGTVALRDELLNTLKSSGLLNDNQFIKLYVESKIHTNPRGVFLLKGELVGLGVDEELVNAYFEKNHPDELQAAKDALRKKWAMFSNYSPFVQKQKAYTHLYRRGFTQDTIRKAIEEFQSEE